MGFPRILSKNNKIYTKLGEFCLSIDGNQFYIVCHTCQQELLTQDTFWKHIQDEHSFMHELKHEGPIAELNRHHSQSYMDSVAAAVAVDVQPPAAALVQHYRKINIKAEHDGIVVNEADGAVDQQEEEEEEEEEQEPKDYTEMRVIEPSAVEVNIKVEQSHMAMANEAATAATNHQQHAPTTLYMPNTGMPPTHIINYASMLQNMPQVCSVLTPGAAVALPQPHAIPPSAAQEQAPKDSSSATSEDGERWYMCDFKPCGQKFKYQSRLQLHSTVHSKVRRFVCEICSASFKQSCNLSTHRKKKHDIRNSRVLIK